MKKAPQRPPRAQPPGAKVEGESGDEEMFAVTPGMAVARDCGTQRRLAQGRVHCRHGENAGYPATSAIAWRSGFVSACVSFVAQMMPILLCCTSAPFLAAVAATSISLRFHTTRTSAFRADASTPEFGCSVSLHPFIMLASMVAHSQCSSDTCMMASVEALPCLPLCLDCQWTSLIC